MKTNLPIRYIETFNLKETEKQTITEAIDFAKGDLTKATKLLGSSRETLYRKVERYDIDVKSIRSKYKRF